LRTNFIMLKQLIIRNYAIIDHLVIVPDAELNIVTGETGAGKSIILGALSLVLGERADTSVLIDKSEKCIVEAHFDTAGHESFRNALKEAELDDDAECIIRREISSSGKSRAFINDTPVTLSVLNRLSSMLMDLHQQFDHLEMRDDHFQMDVLDAMAQNGPLTGIYRQLFHRYRDLSRQLSEHLATQAQLQKEADYKQYLLDELVQAGFKEHEIEEAEQQLRQMAHSERIRLVLQAGIQMLGEGEQPLVQELRKLSQQIQGIADVLPAVQPLVERIASARAELQDISGELEMLENGVFLDPELMQQMQERIDLGYKLLKKHDVQDTGGLILVERELEEALKKTMDLEDLIVKEREELDTLRQQLLDAANGLSAKRKEVAPGLSEKIAHLLTLVGMPDARFEISLQPLPEPGPSGIDAVQFLLDANKSGQFLPLHKAASGGEMSRIMLSVKSLTARAMQLPTLLFDEVDTGISGEASRQVGVLLRDLARYHQVICITHQPQVAAKGTRHFYIYKEPGENRRIHSRVQVLGPDERVLAIARMIGGEQPSEAALKHARELVEA